ncbi:MAG: folate-binding protein YgfZ [Pseudomonadota bacterium]|nr:MAG: folate-binding protein YgfZ [Pseudomonadota bacterium]
MKSDWQRLLIDQGAVTNGDRIEHFGAPQEELSAAVSATAVCDLSHYTLLEISGVDAGEFLQGQLTNDVRQLQDNHSQLSAYCDHKGRMLALFRIWPWQEGFRATLPSELADEVAGRLRMFVLRSKVEIHDRSTGIARLGIAGSAAAALLEQHVGPVPQAVNRFTDQRSTRITRLPGEHPRFELHLPVEHAGRLWQSLSSEARPVGAPCWDLLMIRAAQPEVVAATRSLFTPQMLNLEVLDGVSFNKGCYTGQEVVARTQFLGTIKRRMFPGKAAAETQPPAGGELIGAEAASGQATGRIVLSAPSPDGGYEVLAMVQISAREAGSLHIEGAPAATVELRDPPYSLEQIKPGSQ